MKRIIGTGIAIILGSAVAAGIVYGSALWNAYRFMDTLDRKAAAYEANVGPWPQLQDSCALCHGEKGRAGNARYPSLAGLSTEYLEAQLHAFAHKQRKHPQMSPLAAGLGNAQIAQLAAYYARQTPSRNPDFMIAPPLAERGKALITTNGCATCHGEQLSGTARGPLLAGQGAIYLADQLMAYKRGERHDPTRAMNGIANAMSAQQIQAVADYAARLPPPE